MKMLLKASPSCCEEKTQRSEAAACAREAEGQLDSAFMCPSTKRTFFYIIKCQAQNSRLSILRSGRLKG